jgi:hypothetical protein
LRHDLKAQEKSQREKKTVPADGNRTEGKNRRVDVPNQVMHAVFTLASFSEGSISLVSALTALLFLH